MKAVTLSDARSELVRARVLEGVRGVLERGEPLTFASVAKQAGVPERTLYRHFPTREDLLAAIFDWANQKVGFEGERATDAAAHARQVRRAFSGFDTIAPVIRELLSAPEGRLARVAHNRERQRAALALVQREIAGLDRTSARRIAAVFQLLTAAATWQALRDHWDMDGAEAAETSVLAAELLLEGARARTLRARPKKKLRGRAAAAVAGARS